MTRDEAVKLLRLFTCLDRLPTEHIPDQATVKAALAIVREHSDYQILGICAENFAQAQAALTSYLTAFESKFVPEIPPIDGVIYVKYNPKLRSCHSDSYMGAHRGVLVACQSSYDDDVNEVFGHLPLDLFQVNA
jgi:Domain of unknown function (DUF1824)